MKPVDNLITLSYICMILYYIKLKNPAVFDMLSNFVNSFSSQLPPLKDILNIKHCFTFHIQESSEFISKMLILYNDFVDNIPV